MLFTQSSTQPQSRECNACKRTQLTRATKFSVLHETVYEQRVSQTTGQMYLSSYSVWCVWTELNMEIQRRCHINQSHRNSESIQNYVYIIPV